MLVIFLLDLSLIVIIYLQHSLFVFFKDQEVLLAKTEFLTNSAWNGILDYLP